MFDCESDMNLEMLSDAFWEELEKIKELMDAVSSDFSEADGIEYEDSEETEEYDYKEACGGSNEETKKYQEKSKLLKKYAEEIKENLKLVYREDAGTRENKAKCENTNSYDQDVKSPFERGHKLGCGCPGCSAYREFYGIKLDENTSARAHASGLSEALMAGETRAKEKKTEKYAEETSSRPCKGRHYHLFHGERAELRNVFGSYTNRFNFGRAGY